MYALYFPFSSPLLLLLLSSLSPPLHFKPLLSICDDSPAGCLAPQEADLMFMWAFWDTTLSPGATMTTTALLLPFICVCVSVWVRTCTSNDSSIHCASCRGIYWASWWQKMTMTSVSSHSVLLFSLFWHKVWPCLFWGSLNKWLRAADKKKEQWLTLSVVSPGGFPPLNSL